jgi:hypothetical protein
MPIIFVDYVVIVQTVIDHVYFEDMVIGGRGR